MRTFDLVALGADGKPYSARYEAVNAMLLNEFLKEHRRECAVSSPGESPKQHSREDGFSGLV